MEKAIINERNKDINIGDMIWRKGAAYQYNKNFNQIPLDDVVECGYVTMNVYSEIGMNIEPMNTPLTILNCEAK